MLPIKSSGRGTWQRRWGGSLGAGEGADGRLVVQRKRWQRRWQFQRRRDLQRVGKDKVGYNTKLDQDTFFNQHSLHST